MDWWRHWSLTFDPFDGRMPGFVPLPGPVEAVARLAHAIDSAERSARLVAPAGLGKSAVLRQVLDRARHPSRRIARVAGPVDGPYLFAGLAEGLGVRLPVGGARSRGAAWRSLVEAVRLCRWQRLGVVLAVDAAESLVDPADRRDLDRLDQVAPDPAAGVTVVRVHRPNNRDDHAPERWETAATLHPLTRAEVANYLDARLDVAGRPGMMFTPRAITRLHARSLGVPRAVDRLARLAAQAGALVGSEAVTPDLVESAADELGAMDDASGPIAA